jgi:hypothetical protein
MRFPIIWALSGILTLTACGVPAMPPQGASTPHKTVQTEAPDRPIPTLPAHGEGAQMPATPAATAPISSLPTPAVPEVTVTPSAGTSVSSRTEAESPVPGKLTEAGGEAAIVYRRSGGFAGVSEQWIIYADGRITAGNGRQWQVKPERVEQILDDIQALGFFEMKGRYMPLNTCCDRFTYEITVRRGGVVHTVVTMDAAPDAPVALWQILEKVSSLLVDLPGVR